MAAGIGTVTLIWIFARQSVAWPWFVLIGTAVTFVVGAAMGRGDPSDGALKGTPEQRTADA